MVRWQCEVGLCLCVKLRAGLVDIWTVSGKMKDVRSDFEVRLRGGVV